MKKLLSSLLIVVLSCVFAQDANGNQVVSNGNCFVGESYKNDAGRTTLCVDYDLMFYAQEVWEKMQEEKVILEELEKKTKALDMALTHIQNRNVVLEEVLEEMGVSLDLSDEVPNNSTVRFLLSRMPRKSSFELSKERPQSPSVDIQKYAEEVVAASQSNKDLVTDTIERVSATSEIEGVAPGESPAIVPPTTILALLNKTSASKDFFLPKEKPDQPLVNKVVSEVQILPGLSVDEDFYRTLLQNPDKYNSLSSADKESLEVLVYVLAYHPAESRLATEIYYCESNLEWDAFNDKGLDYSIGPAQINIKGTNLAGKVRVAREHMNYVGSGSRDDFRQWLHVVPNNIKMASYIRDNYGWDGQWGCYVSEYRKSDRVQRFISLLDPKIFDQDFIASDLGQVAMSNR